jgi:hypothetical protein
MELKSPYRIQSVPVSVVFAGLLLLCLGQSCQEEAIQAPVAQEEQAGTPPEKWLKKDSTMIHYLDSLVGVTKEWVFRDKSADTHWIYFEDAPLDSAEVSIYKGELVHVAFQSLMPAQEQWNDVFLKDGNVYFFRYREWNKRPEASSAREIFFYFQDDEKLAYASERYRILKPEDIPADLLFDEMQDCTRTQEDAMSFVNLYWPQLKGKIFEQLEK